MRVLQAAKERSFDIFLVEEVSRFSRDFLGGLTALGELKALGVTLADTKQGCTDLDSSDGQIRIALGLVTSQQETRRLGERSKRGLKGRVLACFSAGGQPPYGYKRVPVFSERELDADGRAKRIGVRFEIDPIESLIVRRVFAMYIDGASKHGIAKALNREAVPTRRDGAMYKGVPVSGTWSAATIKRILENELYRGVRHWNQTSRTGAKLSSGKKKQIKNPETEWVTRADYTPPIVTEDEWTAVNGRLRRDADQYAQAHEANEKRQYLLSGLLRCASCGRSFVVGAHRGSPPTPHYRCSFHTRGRDVCTNATVVSQTALEARVTNLLEVIIKDPKQLDMLIAGHNRRIDVTNESRMGTVHALEAKEASVTREVERLPRRKPPRKPPSPQTK